jgi:cell division septation protein DedD
VTETTDALSGAPAPSPAPAAESGASPNATIVEEAPAATQTTAVVDAIPHYAQLLSTGDQKIAESLAAKLIEKGFTSAYVERGSTEKGPVFRVRVKFGSEPDARAAEGKLKEFSKDVWITAK